MADATAGALFELDGLTTSLPRGGAQEVRLVDGVSLVARGGETLAVVGESGSGKTMTFISALGLAPAHARVGGRALLDGADLLALPAEALRARRGAAISMVFQDPLSALNPLFPVGRQITIVLRSHRNISRREAREQAIALLERVHVPDPHRRVDDYPHQLSGGMRQRVLIAMAIALGPRVLIADEPTTALDVTVQAQIMELLDELRAETGMALVLITHDLGLVARHADRVAIFYAGRVVEEAPVGALFAGPRHPYTRALFRAIPDLEAPAAALVPIGGQPPSPLRLPPGCAFAPRCALGAGREDCARVRPALVDAPDRVHRAACLHWEEAA